MVAALTVDAPSRKFEVFLISPIWGKFQTSLSALLVEIPRAASDILNSLTIQALSAALAGRGGSGIGQMVVHQIKPSLAREQQNLSGGKIKTVSGG